MKRFLHQTNTTEGLRVPFDKLKMVDSVCLFLLIGKNKILVNQK